MLKLKIKGCVHHPKEAQIKKDGVAPYICPIANMVLDQIHEKLKYETSYLAKLAIDEKNKECLAYMALIRDRRQDRCRHRLARRR